MHKQGLQVQRQSLVQDQRLKMNPQLLQSIKLMELPLMDLRERIEQELESNPALEILEDNSTVPLDEAETLRKEEDEYFETTSDPGQRGNELAEEHRRFIEGVLARPETLQEHLLRQIQVEPIDDELCFIAETLIQNLDDDGFHKEKPETLFDTPQPRLQEAMELVRELDPAGTCTSDYRESLMVQIEASLEIPEAVINNAEKALDHLDLVEREKYASLAKIIGIKEEETRVICNFLKTLSPFPGRAFESASSEVRFVIPDVRVVKDKDGFSIILNDETFPVLGTNSFFEKMSVSNDQSTKEFAREKIKEARLFINHLSQRNKTLIRVANAILEFQRSFFMKGPKYLSPLTLGDIAKELQIHETTVSRTAHGKYMQTEWGIFEIRYFFTNSISGAGSVGSQFSKESVKEIIKEIITAENRLLSDQEISALLNQKGIALARRTVAKYRKELDMGSSYTRKVKRSLVREKNSGGSK
ncbi:MAG: RNA polymerase factor sigma-54 [Treponema sp.]|nr:RNA polymerase factor sigma-54 [Treponema sp.]MCL2251309.1 RNA polymerase factor sigma-54 [Treponema sp.]